MLFDPKWEVELDNETVAILKKAKTLIENKSRWTKGEYAKDAAGRFVISALNPSAERFCSVGAVARASGLEINEAEESSPCRFLKLAAREKGFAYPHDLNDKSDHAGVMAMFDRAIELAGATR